MHISVHVRSGDPATDELDLTTHSLIVFVPLDSDGTAVAARPWAPVSEEDVALRDHALQLVAMRNQVDAERHIPEAARVAAGSAPGGGRAGAGQRARVGRWVRGAILGPRRGRW